jgi:hypothetical protein
VGVVVDSSAAYLQRQSLNTLADGAGLAGADAVRGYPLYNGGLDDRIPIDPEIAGQAVHAYVHGLDAETERTPRRVEEHAERRAGLMFRA